MKKLIGSTLVITLLTACNTKLYEPKGVLINAAEKQLSCKQLDEKIENLEASPKTDVYAPSELNTSFAFKSGHFGEIKKLKRIAGKQGCYDRPAYIPPTQLRPHLQNKPVLIDTTRQQLSFDQCFTKCKELTNRSNEQCFDSCK